MKKTALITGCAKGIGKEIALELARDGYDIIATYNTSLKEINEVKNRVEAIGVNIDIHNLDLTSEEDFKCFCDSIKNKYTKIDVLVNNAGISTVKLLSMSKIEEIKSMFDVNYFSMLSIIQKISKRMIKQRKGCIINMGSLAGMESQPGKIAYGSSKAAVMLMTRCLAKELGPFGIRVNSIAPGPVETEMIQQYTDNMLEQLAKESSLKRLAKTEEIASVALFLASEQASYINGEIIKVDGGR